MGTQMFSLKERRANDELEKRGSPKRPKAPLGEAGHSTDTSKKLAAREETTIGKQRGRLLKNPFSKRAVDIVRFKQKKRRSILKAGRSPPGVTSKRSSEVHLRNKKRTNYST